MALLSCTSLTLTIITLILFPTPLHAFSKIFAFGDSYTDTGNTNSNTGPFAYAHVSNLPYGMTFFHHPTNRYSDGRLVVDFLATSLSLPFLPPYRSKANGSHGVNFAVAGSTAIEHEFFVNHNITFDITPQSLSTELKWFDEYLAGKGCKGRGGKECEEVMKGALFWVGEIGTNDYLYSFISQVSTDTVRELSIQREEAFLQGLLERGAKHIIVQGLPLLGCLPITMVLSASAGDTDAIGCVASVNKKTYIHNSLLQSKLQNLRLRYPTVIISYADYAAAHHAVMNNPQQYGFTERIKVCCGAGGDPYNFELFATCGSLDVRQACGLPSKFVNWDGVHFTEAMYKVISDMFFRQGYIKPAFQGIGRRY